MGNNLHILCFKQLRYFKRKRKHLMIKGPTQCNLSFYTTSFFMQTIFGVTFCVINILLWLAFDFVLNDYYFFYFTRYFLQNHINLNSILGNLRGTETFHWMFIISRYKYWHKVKYIFPCILYKYFRQYCKNISWNIVYIWFITSTFFSQSCKNPRK